MTLVPLDRPLVLVLWYIVDGVVTTCCLLHPVHVSPFPFACRSFFTKVSSPPSVNKSGGKRFVDC